MKRRFKRWLIIISGWSFVALGVAGLFLPILQGVLFLLIGLTVLSTEYVWAHNLLQKLRKRFPTFIARFDATLLRAHAWLKRISPSKSDGV
ncbi:MAG TPA: PGPGW domain-containing protein [Terriglobia bacterium]|nr:PGPGW domain-containing protein [Terriglobia bacterium]